MNDTERETPVIFTWADREGSSWWLAAFIFLSFLLHSAAFFLFEGKNPPAPRTVRTASLVQMLSTSADPGARSPEGEALLQWIASHDPAMIAKVQTVEPNGLLDVPYHASFMTLRTQPLAAPLEPPTIQIPSARDPLALIRSVSPTARPETVTSAPQRTGVRLSAALQSRSKETPVITPRTKSSVTVQPTVVLAGVNGEGESRFTFIQQGCSDQTLDSEALAFVRALHFAPSGEALQWGTVTIEWGDDTTAPATPK